MRDGLSCGTYGSQSEPKKTRAMLLAEAVINLDKAARDYEALSRAKEQANRDQTAALNTLNEAQKAFDKLVQDTRASAPNDSEWARKTHGLVPRESHST